MEHDRKTWSPEPQSSEEFIRAIYAKQKDVLIPMLNDIKCTVFGNGKPGLCQRQTETETTLKVLYKIVVIGISALSLLLSWIIFFKE